jgi:segregation and condensation protein A
MVFIFKLLFTILPYWGLVWVAWGWTMDKLDALVECEDLTWRDILHEVLRGLDPWDINLVEVATRYSRRVDEMREMNFRIPANVILVCSVLLRMKADILTPKQEEQVNFAESFDFIFNSSYPTAALFSGDADPYPIAVKPTRVLSRRVTAEELIEAIQSALTERTKNKARLVEVKDNGGRVREIVIEQETSMLVLIEQTYRKIMEILAGREEALFSEIARTRDEIMSTFLSLLHLSNDMKIALKQEQLFGEIYIRPI